jgi:ectoine hydroxylase-related dioxygenase (phytanoyl-CoA dioxygenase family)
VTDWDPGLPPESDFSVLLTDEQVNAFHRDGFTSIPRITTDEEIEWLKPIYDHLFDNKGSFKGGYFDLTRKYDEEGVDLVPQVLAPDVRWPQLRKTTAVRNARAIAQQLMDLPPADIKQWGHMILKPARIGGALPWHQDEAYWDPDYRYRALGVWVPLDDATVASGCMHFKPGSHTGPVLPHQHVNDDPEVHGLVAPSVTDGDEVAVELAPGGATFHHCRTLHRTPPNVSDHVRRAWANEFQIDPVKNDGSEPDRPWVREGMAAWEKRAVFDGADTLKAGF